MSEKTFEQTITESMHVAVRSALKAFHEDKNKQTETFLDLAYADGIIPEGLRYLGYMGRNNGPVLISFSGYRVWLTQGMEIRIPLTGSTYTIESGSITSGMIYLTEERVLESELNISSHWDTFQETIGTSVTQLPNQPAREVTLEADSTNSGTITLVSKSNQSHGLVLSAGQSRALTVGNLSLIWAVASASGQLLNIGVVS